MEQHNRPIVLFDGNCNLCNKSVQFILEKERNAELHFTSLQSENGKALLRQFNYSEDYQESVLFYETGQLYNESRAALKIARYLKAPWSWLRVFWIVPGFMRNWAYRFVAKRRIKWFGSTESCWVMQKEWKGRFLG